MSAIETKPELTRIRSIDFVRGIAICLIVLAHAGGAWRGPEMLDFYAVAYSYLDVFGPSLFIFISSLSVVFSIKRREGKISEKAIRKIVFSRGLSLFVIGLLYNLISVVILGNPTSLLFPLSLWSWTILVFIGFAQIITYYALKLSRGARIVIGSLLIFIVYPLYPFLNANLSNPVVYIIHYIVVSPAPHNPLVPYVSICFFSSIFGEMFVEAMKLEAKEVKLKIFHKFLIYGLLLVIVGIFLTLIDPNPLITVYNFPLFIYRGTPSNIFYCM